MTEIILANITYTFPKRYRVTHLKINPHTVFSLNDGKIKAYDNIDKKYLWLKLEDYDLS